MSPALCKVNVTHLAAPLTCISIFVCYSFNPYKTNAATLKAKLIGWWRFLLICRANITVGMSFHLKRDERQASNV